MVIKKVNLDIVIGVTSKVPETEYPEVAFAGKSNVGKSSLINALMNRKSYARTSSQPGKTQTINYYNINDAMLLVDLPGYGYANVSPSVKEKWGKKYPYAISSWESNWDVISPFFQFSDDIRRIMYTTNIIEGVNRQFRKVTKTKSVFPNDTSLEKMLYLASVNVMKKWKMRYRNWDLVLSQLSLLYEDRLKPYL